MSDDQQPPQEEIEAAAAEVDETGEAADIGGAPPVDAMPPAQLANELELARAEIERLTDQLLRRQAELVNYRRRAQKEMAEAGTVARATLLERLVPVVDDFERAVEAESEDAQTYHEGMQLILRSVQKVLEDVGVERIEPRGEPFDPRYHEAIARHETDEVPDGQVIEVYQTGYSLNDRLIRPATVVVAFSGDGSGGEVADAQPIDDDDA